MRLFLTPRGFEEQTIRRVRLSNPDVLDLLKAVLAPGMMRADGLMRADDLVLDVAVCQDGGGYGDPQGSAARIATHLQTRLALMGLRAQVNAWIFCVMSNVDDMMAKLQGCDIFYMAGIFKVSAHWEQASAQEPVRRLVAEIQTRVQYNLMAFMGGAAVR